MKNPPDLYPVWLRIWHGLNMILFLVLLVTGFSLHFAGEPWAGLAFAQARTWHNVAGMAWTANLAFFVAGHLWCGSWIHYVPPWSGLWQRIWQQAMFYGWGIFQHEPHPFPPTPTAKFNPLQQVTYLAVMGGLVPAAVVSGWLYLFPDWLPAHIMGMSGLLPVALGHLVVALLLAWFMLGHIYLATAGETLFGEFRKMITGFRLEERS